MREIITYLNQKSHKNFKTSSKANWQLIKARLDEGYTVEEFKKLIDNKCAEWLGTEQDQYLRPETLFRPSHFESYLNQRVKGEAIRDEHGNIIEMSSRISGGTFNQFDQHDMDVREMFRRKKGAGNG